MSDLERRTGIHRTFGPITIRLARYDVWVGVGRYLIGVRDHREIPPLFSERYRERITTQHRHYRHVGRWCLFLDTNRMRLRKASV